MKLLVCLAETNKITIRLNFKITASEVLRKMLSENLVKIAKVCNYSNIMTAFKKLDSRFNLAFDTKDKLLPFVFCEESQISSITPAKSTL